MNRWATYLSCITLVACGSSDGEEDPSTEQSSNMLSYSVEATLGAGEETWFCQYIQLPKNDNERIFLSGRSHTSEHAHHYGLYRTRLKKLPDGAKLNDPVTCWEGNSDPMQYTTNFILLEQTPTADVDFPKGVGLAFEPGEILIAQVHAVNAQPKSVPVSVDFQLKTIAADDVDQEMGLLQFYNPYIYIPPKDTAKASLRCKIPSDMTLIEGNGHYHLRGTSWNGFIDPPDGPKAKKPFLSTSDWEHPEQYHGELKIAAGSHFRFECNYRNDDFKPYIQGQSKYDDEMCSFWGYAYPAPEDPFALMCAGEYADSMGVGTNTCGETSECLQSCPAEEAPDLSVPGIFTVGPCYQKCIVDSCPNVVALLDRRDQCLAMACKDECPGSDCDDCAEENCASEIDDCMTAACE